MLSSVERIWNDSLDLIRDIFELFTLEVKLAGKSLVNIIVLLLVMVVLLLTSWLVFLGALIVWLFSLHFHLSYVLLAVAAINLLGALVAAFFVWKNSKHLQFTETRHQLGLKRGEHELTEQN